MHYTTDRKQNQQKSTQSFSGCARDVEEESGILGEVVRKVLELFARSAHDLFEQSYIIQFLLLAHHLLPIRAFDGESHNTSHSSQGFFDCHRLSWQVATPDDGCMFSPALDAVFDGVHHWPFDDLILRPCGFKRLHGLCHCCLDFALCRGFECPLRVPECPLRVAEWSRHYDLPDLYIPSSGLGQAWVQILDHLEGKNWGVKK